MCSNSRGYVTVYVCAACLSEERSMLLAARREWRRDEVVHMSILCNMLYIYSEDLCDMYICTCSFILEICEGRCLKCTPIVRGDNLHM